MATLAMVTGGNTGALGATKSGIARAALPGLDVTWAAIAQDSISHCTRADVLSAFHTDFPAGATVWETAD